MALHKVTVTQVFKATRKITVEVEAEDAQAACAKIDEGEEDVPSFDDPRWLTGWDLQNEETTHA